MRTKIMKGIICLLIMVGICLTTSNFLPDLDAGGIYGTETTLTGDDLWWYYVTYGPEYMGERWLEGDNYCVDYASDCVIIEA